MPMSSMHDTWLLIAPEAALPALRPLIETHEKRRPVRLLSSKDNLQDFLEDAAGLLMVGERCHTPRTALPGPFLVSADGRRVPAGWLPFTGQEDLKRFAVAAAEVQNRSGSGGPIALLGQWNDHVTRMVRKSLQIMSGDNGTPPVPVYWWTADRIIRRDLLTALRIGLGMAMYCGHGRPYGWAGYHGLHSRHLVHAAGRPTGAVLSLTCHTANRYRVGLSFAEIIPLSGVAAAAFSAVRPTKTVENWYWGTSLCEVLAERPGCTLGELVLRACPPDVQWDSYRIIGDPLAPLLGAPDAADACSKVWAPAPDDSPVPPGYLADLQN
ncbi:MAG: C25 family cysteine peptidase [Pseudomonadota bacterium]